ncbi:MAG: aldolase [Candidatus Pacebacteria bacterium]|nr:aldolase [Candidatus Paceibacterota bacterium]
MSLKTLHIPASVPKAKIKEYKKNWRIATKDSGRLMLFAGDQKVEHLNDDFVGKDIHPDDSAPRHLFEIASQSHVGVLASQFGLISAYAREYPKIPYLVKLNSKTNLFETDNPISLAWHSVNEVVELKEANDLNIVGVGYTIYIGSENETAMLSEAAQIISQAHQAGLLAVIWMYPRGPQIKNDEDIHLIAGGAGVAACLGADFVKVKYPYSSKAKNVPESFQEVSSAAGKTGVLCVGGSSKDPEKLLETIEQQIKVSKTRGVAIGRNIHQKSLPEAIRLANAISAITLYNFSLKDAISIYKGKKELAWK